MTTPDAIPLARLFAMGMNSLVSKLHERLDPREFPDVRPAFAFVLLSARDGILTGNDVAQLLGMTKQAASKLLDAMESAHLLIRRPHPTDARAKAIVIAPKGARLLEAAETIYAELEADWAAAIGEDRLAQLRADLVVALRATNAGALPPIRPTR